MSHFIIMERTPDPDPAVEAAHQKRITDIQSLFTEALRRLNVQRMDPRRTTPRRTDNEIIVMALKTLMMNGYSQHEIAEAMGKRMENPFAVQS